MNIKPYLLIITISILAQIIDAQLVRGVSCNDIKIIINKHNDLRKIVAMGNLTGQPKASDMQSLVWDDELQKLAQNWSERMVFMHNPNTTIARFSVGENLYIQFNSLRNVTPDWDRAVQVWFDEYQDYQYQRTIVDPKTGHYTQVVWANTTYVGCGFTAYYTSINQMYNRLYVCNYGPSGNYIGEFPYEVGQGCENLCCKIDNCGKQYGDTCV